MTTWAISVGNEWTGRDPFGVIKEADQSDRDPEIVADEGVALRAARNSYASFKLWVQGSGEFRLSAEVPAPLELDLLRAWYHKFENGEGWFTDALVPVAFDEQHAIPTSDNEIPGQTCQEFWVDVFIPRDATPGRFDGSIVLQADGQKLELVLRVDVVEAVLPDTDAIICNRHSYGSWWLPNQYPETFAKCQTEEEKRAQTISLLHDLYRINYEHRGLLTNRGPGHDGSFDPIYGPVIEGQGREKRIVDWSIFDEHYAPLCDGSAFAQAATGAPPPRRPAKPIWCLATAVSAGWPADYLYWGQPGYEVEFVNCMKEYDAHLREKGWTETRPYCFHFHKKRYRWLGWDGDEPKYAKDHRYYKELGRLWKEAVGDSPVNWLFRLDASWQMKNEFEDLKGIIDWWVCGGFVAWYPDEVKKVRERGDIMWSYNGPPAINSASASILEMVWKVYARGLGGNVEWCTFESCPDPWFASDGNRTQTYYPGERFGIAGPIPSIRLKLQRNGVQDITLLNARKDAEDVTARLTNALPVEIWETPPPVVNELPPEDWDSENLSGSQDDRMDETQSINPLWWMDVRNAALEG